MPRGDVPPSDRALSCGNCGALTSTPFRAPPAETAPDLDLRPGEPTRSTLPRWVRTCTGCGATAPDLSSLTDAIRPVITLPSYRAEKNPFLRWAAIDPQAEAWLQAAWFADDADDAAHATSARVAAAAAWGEPVDTSSALQLLDVLRRAGAFAAAARLAGELGGRDLDESSARIVAFQQVRIIAGDTGRHLISSALRPPARTPHVAHGKPTTGFWRRLFGG